MAAGPRGESALSSRYFSDKVSMRCVHPLFIVCLFGSLLMPAAEAQQPTSSPLKELTAIAGRQLKERADTMAVIRDEAGARARQSEVRARVLSLIGGLPDYRGPLNARVTKTILGEGFAIDNVLFESLPG